ncbi:MAG: hypothetical protein Q8O99_07980 [bacterium]|nr:hypothetical protein [bacterium]
MREKVLITPESNKIFSPNEKIITDVRHEIDSLQKQVTLTGDPFADILEKYKGKEKKN